MLVHEKGVNEELRKTSPGFLSTGFLSNRTLELMIVFTLLLCLLSSCSVPFIPQVPPSSYSTEAAINVLSSKYYLLDSGFINGFGDILLGDGKYAVFDGVDGILMVFRYENKDDSKEKWSEITSKYGKNPLKLKYMKINMGTYGIFTIRLENTDLYAWYKENWLIVITGDKIDQFIQDVNDIYKAISS